MRGESTAADARSGGPLLCAPGAILPFRLAIDATKDPPVWGSWVANGARVEIRWPPNFSLSMVPEVAVRDPNGDVVGRSGDVIDYAGGTGSDTLISICTLRGVDYPLE